MNAPKIRRKGYFWTGVGFLIFTVVCWVWFVQWVWFVRLWDPNLALTGAVMLTILGVICLIIGLKGKLPWWRRRGSVAAYHDHTGNGDVTGWFGGGGDGGNGD
jgi:hypothetical protein